MAQLRELLPCFHFLCREIVPAVEDETPKLLTGKQAFARVLARAETQVQTGPIDQQDVDTLKQFFSLRRGQGWQSFHHVAKRGLHG